MGRMPRLLVVSKSWRASFLLGFFMVGQALAAPDTSYLTEMPEPARVLADIHGSNALDTTARQAAALGILRAVITTLSESASGHTATPEERALQDRYLSAFTKIQNTAYSELDPTYQAVRNNTPPRLKEWRQLFEGYGRSDAFVSDLVQRYLSSGNSERYLKEFRRSLAATLATEKAIAPKKPQIQQWTGAEAYPYLLLLSAVLLLAAIAREARPFGLDPSDPFKLRAGWSRYDVHSVTGEVISPSKAIETVTHVTGGGNQSVSSSSHSYVHDQFFVRLSGGRERAFKAVGVDLALRDGHVLSVAWVIRKGKESGPYLLFRNHSTNDRRVMDETVQSILKSKAWPVIPVAALGWMSANYGGIALSAIAFLVARGVVNRWRVRRFKSDDVTTLVAVLDARASQQAKAS